jgi:UTP--glucose-1-phosphate uridylyltransferase
LPTVTTIDTAIVPCGGRGTRLYPISRWIPKELLPVGLRPLLFWTFDEIVAAGLRRAIGVTNPGKPLLEAVAREYGPALALEFVPQDSPLGLGDALLRARGLLSGAPFAVVLPDNLFQGPNPLAAVLRTWSHTGLPAVLLARVSRTEAAGKGPTGRAAVRAMADGSLRVVAIADKGEGRFDPGDTASAMTPIGRFALPGDVFAEFDAVARTLTPGAELDDVPVLQRLAARGALAGTPCEATFYDVGVPEGYHDAVAALPPRT